MNNFDKEHLRNLNGYQKKIEQFYNDIILQAVSIAGGITSLGDEIFSFDSHPELKKRVQKLLKEYKNGVYAIVVNGIDAEWTLSNNKNNELANYVFGKNVEKLTEAQYKRYFSTNDAARKAFIARKEGGLNLSDRVWNYTNQFKSEIELGLDVGIRNGQSAAEMARDLKNYLQQPDKLFRLVRDEHGDLKLSKAAEAYHPGRGVYRSSYKNARRLAATEANIAYRTSDYERWQQLDFVVGIEIKLSNNHTTKDGKGNIIPLTDICDDLQGRYPKSFKWTGWHPHCRCHAVTILKTQDEFNDGTKKILRREEPGEESVNTVKDMPQAFKDWTKENAKRIDASRKNGNLPYFLKNVT